MQNQFEARISAPGHQVYPILADLSRYPEFLDIVSRVEPDLATGVEQAWLVTLRAKIGPFARSKRLRMVRTIAEPHERVRFERAEQDGREHSAWTLEAVVGHDGDGSLVAMSLDYGGRLWSGAVDAVLQAEVSMATARLNELAAG